MTVMIRGSDPRSVVTGLGSDPPSTGDIGKVDRTGIVANIATTNITDSRPAGVYVLIGELECTVVGTGTIGLNAVATDDVGSSSYIIASKSMIALGRVSFNIAIYLASGNITWSTSSYASGTYAIRMRCIYAG